MNHNLKLKALKRRALKEQGINIKDLDTAGGVFELYEKIKEDLETKLPKGDEDKEESPKRNRPYCVTDEEGLGYLKFRRYGERIKIGRASSQPFKLLQSLTEPFGTAKSVDTVFEAMREKCHHKYSELNDSYLSKAKKVQLITNSGIKELQKGNKLRGKLKFRFDETKSKIWLEYLG